MKEFDFTLEPGQILKDKYDVQAVLQEGKPLISVITAYYNAAQYFEQTFNSVLNQTFPWFEWIIVNDGSTKQQDVDFLKKNAEKDARIKVIDQKNAGAVSARNNGINQSQSDVIVILDADDLIDCRYLEMVFWGLLCNKEVKWAYTDSVGFHQKEYSWQKEFSSENMREENILSYIAAIRKEVFADGVYDASTKNNWEDWQLWLKLLAKGYQPFHIRKRMFWYRRLSTGMLSKIEEDTELRKNLQGQIDKLAQDVPDGIRAVCPDNRKELEFAEIKTYDWKRKLPYKKKKINILFLLPHMECGGADKFNVDIIRNLDKDKYELGVVTTVGDENEWEDKFAREIDDVFEMPRFLHKKDWISFIYYYIQSRQVDIVFNISSYWGYYILPLLKIDFPHMAIIDCVHAEGNYWRNGGYPRVSGKFSSIIEKTFVSNDFTRNILVKKYGAIYEKTKLIYTGVDEKEFREEVIDCTKEREKYNILPNRPTVLYLCRMCPEKRPFMMLEIAEKVIQNRPDVQFLAVGGGEYLEELKQKVNEMGLQDNVIFTGRVEDTKPFYKMSDLFLLCSLKEGLSVTTLEAMIMGLPLISADVGSQYELVSEETGKLIRCRADEQQDFYNRRNDSEEVREYAEAICEWINNLETDREKVKSACKNKIKNGFTLKDLIQTLDKVFTELTSQTAISKRISEAETLSVYRGMFEELMILCNSFGSKEAEVNEIWQSKEWQYQQLRSEIVSMEQRSAGTLVENQRLEGELQRIYSLRSWRLITRYHKMMNETAIGKVLSALRRKILK